jgi:hypothetical protein
MLDSACTLQPIYLQSQKSAIYKEIYRLFNSTLATLQTFLFALTSQCWTITCEPKALLTDVIAHQRCSTWYLVLECTQVQFKST